MRQTPLDLGINSFINQDWVDDTNAATAAGTYTNLEGKLVIVTKFLMKIN